MSFSNKKNVAKKFDTDYDVLNFEQLKNFVMFGFEVYEYVWIRIFNLMCYSYDWKTGLKNRFFVHEITIEIRSLPLKYMINDFNKFY